MEGIVVGLRCGVYSVLSEGVIFRLPARGLFRNKGVKPVVGDKVLINDDYSMIIDVFERTSFLKRPTIANLDQILLVFSLKEPEFSYHLTFKYLTYANMNNIKAKIILTKLDKTKDLEEIENIKNVFNKLGYEVFVVSNKTKEGLEEVRHIFKNKISCLVGQSGVGKSSLLNAIDPEYDRSIGEYSKALGRGKHETKETILLPYEGGFIADTPGFSSLDLELFKEDLAQFFPSFDKYYLDCYFSNCLHISEPKCLVKQALENGDIPQIAYDAYLKLSSEAIYKSKRGY
ncbi:MAG: ribosome small subunit-dependent GTPase A [Bacilli bacterium]|nr:ribosome small subunit-dependent GTPase A [Bacilli bacterium]